MKPVYSLCLAEGCQQKVGPASGQLPVNLGFLDVAELVVISHKAVLGPELVDQAGDLDIITAVFGHFPVFSITPPLDGIQALGGLARAKGRGGHGIEFHPVADHILDTDHQVKAEALISEAEWLGAFQDSIIKIDVVKANDEIGLH